MNLQKILKTNSDELSENLADFRCQEQATRKFCIYIISGSNDGLHADLDMMETDELVTRAIVALEDRSSQSTTDAALIDKEIEIFLLHFLQVQALVKVVTRWNAITGEN